MQISNGVTTKICFASIDVENKGIEEVNQILEVFKKYDIPATLFVTGEVLEKYSDLVKEWSKNYEIASHSFTHRFWNSLSFEERKTELDSFNELFQKVFQISPKGFRAPSHVMDEDGLKILEEKGFLYDSSILPRYVPFKKYRGYQGRKPLLIHYPAGLKILEIPVRGQLLGVPLAGAWIKGLPLFFYKFLFFIHSPSFITLNMHSWDSLSFGFVGRLEKIIKLLKKKNYLFLNGE
ncbi:MAG: polysaccharide deacetylase family protein, partial [Candidatus Nealsonbacteria bacterium]|nr:polysaccharide deacetylase family protein [Candidatus Nealsonbacteria bacterium]